MTCAVAYIHYLRWGLPENCTASLFVHVLRLTCWLRAGCAPSLQTRLHESISSDYATAMRHSGMQPYSGHEAVWALVSRFSPEAYRCGRITSVVAPAG